ncbi:MAG: gamma-glutamylcyclotransferase family protein [Candidatus Berkiellales bacterium]
MKRGPISYFAYGSNLDIAQMKERIGDCVVPKSAKLTGYQLAFNKKSQERHCGVANLVYTGNPADAIEGMIYQISEEQLHELDMHEGFEINTPEKNPEGYKRQEITLADGSKAIAYIANVRNANSSLKPNAAYMKLLLSARKNGFISEGYFNKLLDVELQEGIKVREVINAQPSKK